MGYGEVSGGRGCGSVVGCSAVLPRDAHRLISHDHEEAGPLAFREPSHGEQNSVVNLVPIRLTQANYQDARVPGMAPFRETLVGGDQHSLFGQCQCPQLSVGKPLFCSAPNVSHVVTEFEEGGDGHQGDVLVYQDVHSSVAGDLNRGNLLFGERGGIVEASQDVLAGQGGVFAQ